MDEAVVAGGAEPLRPCAAYFGRRMQRGGGGAAAPESGIGESAEQSVRVRAVWFKTLRCLYVYWPRRAR